jgi:Uncharacterized protein conserved in bacteria
MQSFHEKMCKKLSIAERSDVDQLSPLTLAFIGDTVFDLAVRTMLIQTDRSPVHVLHVESAKRVRASAQAEAAQALFESLNEQEQAIYRRARNAKPGSVPKNASLQDYAAATAFEAVIGHLYLTNQEERMLQCIEQAIHAQTIAPKTSVKPFKK